MATKEKYIKSVDLMLLSFQIKHSHFTYELEVIRLHKTTVTLWESTKTYPWKAHFGMKKTQLHQNKSTWFSFHFVDTKWIFLIIIQPTVYCFVFKPSPSLVTSSVWGVAHTKEKKQGFWAPFCNFNETENLIKVKTLLKTKSPPYLKVMATVKLMLSEQ